MMTLMYKSVTGVYDIHQNEDGTHYYFGTIGTPSAKEHITFEGETMEELEKDFKEAAEEYIADYGEKLHHIAIPASLYASLKEKASSQGQSVSSYVRHALASIVL